MNARRFPRTLNEAFPFGPEYGCSIEVFKRKTPLHQRVLYWLAPVCVVVAIAFNNYGA